MKNLTNSFDEITLVLSREERKDIIDMLRQVLDNDDEETSAILTIKYIIHKLNKGI